MINVPDGQLESIRKILKQLAPDCEVRVFGSRINGTAKEYSDLDLALVGESKLGWSYLEKLKDTFAESNIPIRVDIHDWNALSESFLKSVGNRYEIL